VKSGDLGHEGKRIRVVVQRTARLFTAFFLAVTVLLKSALQVPVTNPNAL
jgi:hypothetical protein